MYCEVIVEHTDLLLHYNKKKTNIWVGDGMPPEREQPALASNSHKIITEQVQICAVKYILRYKYLGKIGAAAFNTFSEN